VAGIAKSAKLKLLTGRRRPDSLLGGSSRERPAQAAATYRIPTAPTRP
jgi:hypothetical protein